MASCGFREILEFTDDGQYIVVSGTSANLIDIDTGQPVGDAFDNSGLQGSTVAHSGRNLVSGVETRILVWESCARTRGPIWRAGRQAAT